MLPPRSPSSLVVTSYPQYSRQIIKHYLPSAGRVTGAPIPRIRTHHQQKRHVTGEHRHDQAPAALDCRIPPSVGPAAPGRGKAAPMTAAPDVGELPAGEGTGANGLEVVGLSAAALSAVAAAVEASVADNTRMAYTSDWTRFQSWCAAEGQLSLPADPLVVAAYLVAASSVLKADGTFAYAPATVTRWCSSINNRHNAAGFDAPGRSEVVRRTLAGIRKTRATPPRRVRPLRLVDVHTIVTALRDKADSPQAPFAAKVFERRNSAVLLLLLFGALRSDELTRLQIGDVTQETQSLHLAIRRSKTDQQATGQVRGLPWRANHWICPLCAHTRWREVIDAADTDGHPGVLRLLRGSAPFTGHVCQPDLRPAADPQRPLIRALTPAGRVTDQVLTGTGMYRMIRTTAAAAGFPDHIVIQLGAHSPRAGMVTGALEAGAHPLEIIRHTGHSSVTAMDPYYRDTPLVGSAITRLDLPATP